MVTTIKNNSVLNSPYLLLSIVIFIWGVNYVVGRLLSAAHPDLPGFGEPHISGMLYGFFRYLFGAFTMIAVIAYQKKGPQAIREEIRPYQWVLYFSAFVSAIFVLSAHASHEYIPSGTTSIIINLCPIIVFVFGVFFLNEKTTPVKILGFLLGLVGGVVFLWNSIQETAEVNLIGIILSLVAMLAWGGYTISLHYMEGGDRYIIMTVKHASSTLMIIPFLIIFLMSADEVIFVLDIWTVLGILFAGVIASGLAYLLYFNAIEQLGAPRASSFLFLVPFVSVLGDFVIGEAPALITLLGGVVAMVGVALVKLSKEKSPMSGHTVSDGEEVGRVDPTSKTPEF